MRAELAVERFWSKVRKTDTCWLWTGATNNKGYGLTTFDGRRASAHRVAFILSGKTIPAGLTLDHLCRTPLCCNPDHLESVTRRENTIRELQAIEGRASCRKCGAGIRGAYTFCWTCWKLLDPDRKEAIRVQFVPGTLPSRQSSPAYWDAIEAAAK